MRKPIVLFTALVFSFALNINDLAQAQTEEGARESADTGAADLRGARYWEIGATLGLPAVLNGVVGYWFGPIGLRLSGMYWGDDTEEGSNGIQCDIGCKLLDNANTLHSFAAVGGTRREPCCDWSYLGAAYSLNYKWFFLEIGLGKIVEIRREAGPLGSFHGIVQIGYMHRFLP